MISTKIYKDAEIDNSIYYTAICGCGCNTFIRKEVKEIMERMEKE